MISNKSAFKMWLPDKKFDNYLQSANNPDLLNIKQRIEDEKHSPLRTLIEWFKIISNLKVKEKDQSSNILEEFISFKIIHWCAKKMTPVAKKMSPVAKKMSPPQKK